jgi:hypothetical protein
MTTHGAMPRSETRERLQLRSRLIGNLGRDLALLAAIDAESRSADVEVEPATSAVLSDAGSPHPPPPAGEGCAALRDRLRALRDDLRQRLADADALDGGLLRVLADVETVIAGLDRDA